MDEEFYEELQDEYDRIIAETMQKLRRDLPITREKLVRAMYEANKRYWTARTALIDEFTTMSAERTAAALAIPYLNAAQELAEQVMSIYGNYESAFHLTQREARELIDHTRFDRPLFDILRSVADGMPAGEERDRIYATISAPAYRYRIQRAEVMQRQAQEICGQIAQGEVATVREFLQTDVERAANITLEEVFGQKPSDTIIAETLGIPTAEQVTVPAEVPQLSEVSTDTAPIRDFTPTTDAAIGGSFTLPDTKTIQRITETDWSGKSFSSRIWNNTDTLAKEVKDALLWGELTGAGEVEIAAKIRDRFNVAMYKARRVVRTEHTYMHAQTELANLIRLGVRQYEFMSLHEERDCETCDALDGNNFDCDSAVPGVNLPPIHPNCRCRICIAEPEEQDIEADWEQMLKELGITEEEGLERVEAKLGETPRLETAEENGLTNQASGGIIEEKEYGYQYGDEAISIDREYIDSDDYAKRFDNITDNPAVNRTLLECSREALRGNDGTKHEYMYIIDANTGKVLASCLDSPGESGVIYNDEIKTAIAYAKETGTPIIGLHNHPEGAPPSVDDFNKAHDNGYVFGFIPGHNGQLYMYNNPGKTIDKEDAEAIHFNIGLLCRDGADPDRIYRAEYEQIGLEYQIIGR